MSTLPRPARASTAATAQLQEELAALAAEAGIDSPADPLAESGDLKGDIDSFTTLETCVRAHASSDTLLGDALDALGYDTFTRDACRTVQALKTRTVEACRPIAFATLRTRCQVQVATLLGDPGICPTSSLGGSATARDATCLARSTRDPRLCIGALEGERATCRAMVTGELAHCGTDRGCTRQVMRWRAVLERPAATKEITTAGTAEIVVDDQPPVLVDLAGAAESGAILRKSGERRRLIVGTRKNALWAHPQDPWAKPQLSLDVVLPRQAPAPATAANTAPALVEVEPFDLTFDLLVPHVAELSAATAMKRLIAVSEGGSIGSPLSIELRLELTQAPRRYAVSVHLQTFVREALSAPRTAEPRPDQNGSP